MTQQLLIAVLSAATALTTVLIVARIGYHWGFDPIDAFVLAVAGYLGFLVVGGLFVNLLPWGLSTPGVGLLVFVGFALSLVATRVDRRVNPHAADFAGPGLPVRQQLRRLGGWRAGLCAATATALVSAALVFSHQAEKVELTPANVSIFVAGPPKHRVLIVDNQTAISRVVILALNGSRLTTFRLMPGAQHTTPLRKARGTFDITAYAGPMISQASEAGTLRLTGLRPVPRSRR